MILRLTTIFVSSLYGTSFTSSEVGHSTQFFTCHTSLCFLHHWGRKTKSKVHIVQYRRQNARVLFSSAFKALMLHRSKTKPHVELEPPGFFIFHFLGTRLNDIWCIIISPFS